MNQERETQHTVYVYPVHTRIILNGAGIEIAACLSKEAAEAAGKLLGGLAMMLHEAHTQKVG